MAIDDLALRDAERAERGRHVDGWIEPRQRRTGDGARARFVGEQAELRDRRPQKHVLGYVEPRNLLQLLVDHGDSGQSRRLWRQRGEGLARQLDIARIRSIDAREDFKQCRLASAVLADERVHLARANGKTDIIQRLHAGKGLRHAGHDKRGGRAR